ncbi:hypothetical protein V5O48_017773, partial [Marasmius crinis-equi]
MEILALHSHTIKFLGDFDYLLSLKDYDTLLNLADGETALALWGLHSVLKIKEEGEEHSDGESSDEDEESAGVTIRHASFTDFLNDQSRSGTFFLDPAYYGPFSTSCVIHYLNCLLGNLNG